MLIDELENIVQKCLPQTIFGNMNVDLNALKRLAIRSFNSDGIKVHYYPIENLFQSNDCSERISQMFQFQSQWNENDLFDYLFDFEHAQKFINKFCVKFSQNISGVKCVVYKLKSGIFI